MDAKSFIDYINENINNQEVADIKDKLILMIDKIKEAEKIKFEDFTKTDIVVNSNARLPFQICFFDIEPHGSIFVLEDPHDKDLAYAFPILKEPDGEIVILSCFIITLSLNTGLIRTLDLKPIETVLDTTKIKISKRVQKVTDYLIKCLHILNNSNTKLIDNEVLDVVKKGKMRKYKRSIFSYKTLEIKASEEKIVLKNPVSVYDEKRSSPREHLRRGHIRKIGDNRIWVSSCTVGNKEKGIVKKNYRVS